MAIEFNCPNCQKLLRTGDDKAGRRARCPDCGTSIEVPQPDEDLDLGSFDVEDEEEDEFYQQFGGTAPPRRRGSTAAPQGLKTCPMCGEEIQAAAIRCRYCGEDLAGPRPVHGAGYVKPHRGGLILAFSILGWVVCFIFGIVALVMANEDLGEMTAGRMDPSGEGLTRAGKIIAIVQLCLLALVIVGWCLLAIVAGLG